MHSIPSARAMRASVLALGTAGLLACRSDSSNAPAPFSGAALSSVGRGDITSRYTAEVWTRGNAAYTSTWGTRGNTPGNVVNIWNVAGATPALVDSLVVENATTLGDVVA